MKQLKSVGHYWHNITKKTINYTDLDRINARLYKIVEIARRLERSTNRSFHPDEMSWLAEHRWASPYYLLLLPESLRENQRQFQELVTHVRGLSEWLPEDIIRVLINEIRHSTEASALYQDFLDNLSWVQTICDIKSQLEQSGILGLLYGYCSQQVNCWTEIIKAAKAQHWLDEIEEQFKIRTPREIEKIREALRALLVKKRETDKLHIQTRYQERLQPVNELGNMGLLRLRRVGSNPHTSLRKLYVYGFGPLHMLRPVLLTNPETASSILELKPGLYDLAIIDEASQMFMADSLPILYRANSVVISGDGMQMPPSDFFLSGVSESDIDTEEDEDYPKRADSGRLIAADGEYCLLDAAEHAAQVGSPNKKRLLVHYRSEFKELINFSNYAFYEGKLIVPDGNLGKLNGLRAPIELHQIQGVFINGENEAEANKVVQKLKDLWKDQKSPSTGVIAFNVRQRDKILERLFEEAQADIRFAQRLDEERNRKTDDGEDIGFFVRSVEHVQGDERDIIILSTTYDGTTRNFGPISKREKGRRRFNVAITRARLGMVIVSSLNIDRISNEGQRENSENYYFWKYMCYARAVDRGNSDEATHILNSLIGNSQPQQHTSDKLPDSIFEVEVAEFLRQKGFYVEYQIGESGFRIDLGIKRSAKEPRFLCGIECDGKQYHSSWKARLNDIWRQDILKEKGWRILRIWSTDWFSNQEHTKQKLLSQLSSL